MPDLTMRAWRGCLELGFVLARASGRADDVDDARLRGEAGKGDAGCRRGEVDDAFGMEKRGERIVGHGNADRAEPGDLAGILADEGGAGTRDCSMQGYAISGVDEPDQSLSHAARRANHHQLHRIVAHIVSIVYLRELPEATGR